MLTPEFARIFDNLLDLQNNNRLTALKAGQLLRQITLLARTQAHHPITELAKIEKNLSKTKNPVKKAELNSSKIKHKIRKNLILMQARYLKGLIYTNSPLKNPNQAQKLFFSALDLVTPYNPSENVTKEDIESLIIISFSALEHLHFLQEDSEQSLSLFKAYLSKVFKCALTLEDYLSEELWQSCFSEWMILVNLLLQSHEYLESLTVATALERIYRPPHLTESALTEALEKKNITEDEFRKFELATLILITQLNKDQTLEEKLYLLELIVDQLARLKKLSAIMDSSFKPNFNALDQTTFLQEKMKTQLSLLEEFTPPAGDPALHPVVDLLAYLSFQTKIESKTFPPQEKPSEKKVCENKKCISF